MCWWSLFINSASFVTAFATYFLSVSYFNPLSNYSNWFYMEKSVTNNRLNVYFESFSDLIFDSWSDERWCYLDSSWRESVDEITISKLRELFFFRKIWFSSVYLWNLNLHPFIEIFLLSFISFYYETDSSGLKK